MENLSNINYKIETNNNKEREIKLLNLIEQISLFYANKKFKEEKGKKPDYKFSEAVKKFTPTEDLIGQKINCLEGFNFLEKEEKILLFFKELYQKIDDVYNPETENIEDVLDIINREDKEFKKYLQVENLKEIDFNTKQRETKVFQFNQINDIENYRGGIYRDLLQKGFCNIDKLTEIHVDNFFSSGNNSLGSELIKNDLSVIATNIVNKYPQTAAVVGKSWLLDTSLGKALGFKTIKMEQENQFNDFSVWNQFMDKDGNINQSRLNKFMQDEKVPYKSVVAYIPVEDFLKRYLPKNKRGKIILKKINKEKSVFWEKIKEDSQKIKGDWDKSIKNDIEFENFLKGTESLNMVLNFLDIEDKEKYLIFLKKMFSKKIKWSDIFKYKNKEITLISNKIDDSIKNDLYEDNEIFIE